MAPRVTHERAECPVARATDIIGDRWSLLIVRDAFDGITRFSDFQRNLGLAKNILASRLRDLVGAEILEAVPASAGSAYHKYTLTEKGRELFGLIVAIRQWGEKYLFEDHEPHSVLLDTEHERPVGPLQVVDAAGHPLTSSDTFVRKVSPADPDGS